MKLNLKCEKLHCCNTPHGKMFWWGCKHCETPTMMVFGEQSKLVHYPNHSTVLDPVIIHIAPRGAKKEEGFGGVILKSERPSGALFTNSGPPFFTVESKIEVLSPLGTSFY